MNYYIIKESSKNLSVRSKLKKIDKIKNFIGKDKYFKYLFKKYKKDLSMVDEIPIDFVNDIEVSAQTINGSIKLNSKLFNKPFSLIMRYVVHEMVHVFQHIDGLKDDGSKKNYLDNKDEVEAFQEQIKFDANNKGKEEAVSYTKKLIKFHKYPKNKRDQKLDELTEGLEDVENNTDKSRGDGEGG